MIETAKGHAALENVDARTRGVTVVTGPARSGTSCVTALLERCGLDLGTRLAVDRLPSPLNPRGHFENLLMLTVNRQLLREAGGSPLRVPDARRLAEVAASRDSYFDLFLRQFDGRLCKDPVMCLTLPHWEMRWPALCRVVFCLRHPLAVAQSMQKRYVNVPQQRALDIWRSYAERFFAVRARVDVIVFDVDAFAAHPHALLSSLLKRMALPQPGDLAQIAQQTFEARHLNAPPRGEMPTPLADLYDELRRRSIAAR